MNREGRTKNDILKMIEEHQITSEQGLEMLRQQVKVTRSQNSDLLYFEENWEEYSLETDHQAVIQKTWIIFDADEKWIDFSGSNRVILVMPGNRFRDVKEDIYTINPQSREDYAKLFQNLQTKGITIRDLIYQCPGAETDNELIKHTFTDLCAVVYLTQALMHQRPVEPIRLIYLSSQPDFVSGAIMGFVKTLQNERPDFQYKVLHLEMSQQNLTRYLQIIESELYEKQDGSVEIYYKNGKRLKKVLKECSLEDKGNSLIQNRGVYLITGGAGGLGIIFAEHIIKNYSARVVIAGRSEYTVVAEKSKIPESLKENITYFQADISIKEEAEDLIRKVKQSFGRIHGVIHNAGIIRDSFILKKTKEEIAQVLAPKIYGTVYINEAVKKENPDFFIVSSSLSSDIGSVGQSDYAYANKFMDLYMEKQAKLSSKTVYRSVKWPFWKHGGMNIHKAQSPLPDKLGLAPLENEQGISVLEQALQNNKVCITVLSGDKASIRRGLLKEDTADQGQMIEEDEITQEDDSLKKQLFKQLKEIFIKVTKLSGTAMGGNTSFEDLGIDSIVIMGINKELEKKFGILSKTILYEYQNLNELTEYFMKNHRSKLLENIGDIRKNRNVSKKKLTAVPINDQKNIHEDYSDHKPETFSEVTNKKIDYEQDVAIIGISGRYPLAEDIKEFWENISQGKDCITEIPEDRWDYKDFYNEQKGIPGKSYSKWGGFIKDADKFDALFFHISPKEAAFTDPQERIFLETTWHAMENAGYTREAVKGKNIGVFAGVMWGQYQMLQEEVDGNIVTPASSYASIANRVSYFFDFHGPSMAIDTMCSSSLTAIHYACESIRNKDISMAVAGGVNLSIHPAKYNILSLQRFISNDGRCRSFGEGGDGYVPGEGVGVVILKSLKNAIKDHDRIYGIIKASAINHCGKTNGYTVPSPIAQSDLIADVLKKSGINPRTIGYLEAHGTGTALGDPIEITGLSKAFGEYTTERQFCSIGSVKSNIGHLESASGIAGLTKVLLQMKYKKLVPTLHAHNINSNISFEKTPFYLQLDGREWERTVIEENGKKIKYPRRAAISSFGAGGANAHLILEEYDKISCQDSKKEQEELIVLSAKNQERLKEYASQMISFIKDYSSTEGGSLCLKDLAYTLHRGREEMEERLAVVAENAGELMDRLSEYMAGQEDIETLYRGNVKAARLYSGIDEEEEEDQHFLNDLVRKRKLHRIANLWVTGIHFDWNALSDEDSNAIISCPGYPFERERYWWTKQKVSSVLEQKKDLRPEAAHPLIDSNKSTFDRQYFRKILHKKASQSLSSSVMGINIIMPGLFLDIIKAAGNLSQGGQKVSTLRNIKWTNPCTAKESTSLHIYLKKMKNTVIGEIVENLPENPEAAVQCELIFENDNLLVSGDYLNHRQWEEECQNLYSKQECSSLLQSMGYEHGESAAGIREFRFGGSKAFAVVDISGALLCREAAEAVFAFIVEAIVQEIGLLRSIGGEKEPIQLAAVEEIRHYDKISEECYVYIQEEEQWYHAFAANKEGKILTELKGIKTGVVVSADSSLESAPAKYLFKKTFRSYDANDIREKWIPESVLVFCGNKRKEKLQESFRHQKIKAVFAYNGNHGTEWDRDCVYFDYSDEICGQKTAEELRKVYGKFDLILDLPDLLTDWDDEKTGFMGRLALIQSLMKNMEYDNLKIIRMYLRNSIGGAELNGFIAMLGSEYKKVISKNIEMDVASDNQLMKIILNEANINDNHSEVRYINNQRYVADLEQLIADNLDQGSASLTAVTQKAVVITGGTRGIGAAVAIHLAEQGIKKIVLMGRQEIPQRQLWDEIINHPKADRREVIALIQKLEGMGVTVRTFSGSLTDDGKISEFFDEVRENLGEIGGVVHCAGLSIPDKPSFINKSMDVIKDVFEPKADGLRNLHQVFRKDNLEFFVLFSSVSGIIPSMGVGVSDYAAANAYMNRFVEYRHSKGDTYYMAINWPSFKEIGMGEVESPVYKNLGFVSLTTEQGMSLLDLCLKNKGQSCLLPCILQDGKVNPGGFLKVRPENMNLLTSTKIHPKTEIVEPAKDWLIEIFAKELGLKPEKMDRYTDFGDYGVDSIILVEIIGQVEKRGNIKIDSTAFLENPTIHLLSKYIDQVKGAINQKDIQDNMEQDIEVQTETQEDAGKESSFGQKLVFKNTNGRTASRIALNGSCETVHMAGKEEQDSKIAVIGIGCRFPQAPDRDKFWDNLKNGVDCICEIPASRWEKDGFYSAKYESDKSISKWGGFVSDVDGFDADYFNFTEEEAQTMDPLIKNFLEVSIQTLRDAGYENKEVSGKKAGVFVGARAGSFVQKIKNVSKNSIIGIGQNFIAAHLAHFLNLKGPNMVVDTACSSSLTSIHLACQSLRLRETDLAFAGGVDILFDKGTYILLSEGRALSPDGKCHTFDEKANGFVPGEGCGAVLLKPYEKAVRDGDKIYAVIESSAINNDGRTMGITTPNPKAQAEVIQEALEKGNINADSIGYVEAHGTGTMIGDPIELKALTEIFSKYTDEKQFCAVGSVKTNVGHLLSAAGIASFIKVVLSLNNGEIPPTLHCEKPNPRFAFEESPFYPVNKLTNWEPRHGVRRAGISSFGFGGTNVHMIVSGADRISGHSKSRESLAAVKFNKKHFSMEETADMFADFKMK